MAKQQRSIEEKVWLKEQFGDEIVYDCMKKEDLLVEYKLQEKRLTKESEKVASIGVGIGFLIGILVGIAIMIGL